MLQPHTLGFRSSDITDYQPHTRHCLLELSSSWVTSDIIPYRTPDLAMRGVAANTPNPWFLLLGIAPNSAKCRKDGFILCSISIYLIGVFFRMCCAELFGVLQPRLLYSKHRNGFPLRIVLQMHVTKNEHRYAEVQLRSLRI